MADLTEDLGEFCYTLYRFDVLHAMDMRESERWLHHPEMGKFARLVMLMGNDGDDLLSASFQYEPSTAQPFAELIAQVHRLLTKGELFFAVINNKPRLCLAREGRNTQSQLTRTELARQGYGVFKVENHIYLGTFDAYVSAALAEFEKDSPIIMKEAAESNYDAASKTRTAWCYES